MTLTHVSVFLTPMHLIRRRGFSLVETVLAMAVMSLAVTVLLGLLPHGLEMSRKAGISAGEARINSDIVGELSQVDWSSLPSYDNRKFYFDDQGVRLDDGSGGDSLVSYVARVRLPGMLRLPGSASDSVDLQRAVIEIASTGNRGFDFSAKLPFSTYTAILSRTQ